VASASSKVIFQVISIAFGAMALYWLFFTLLQLADNSQYRLGPDAQMARLRVLGLRDQTLPLHRCNNLTFGFLRDGCPEHTRAGSLVRGDEECSFLLYPVPLGANGYYLNVSDGPAAADPLMWAVEVSGAAPDAFDRRRSAGGGPGQWQMIGASAWHGPYPVGELFPNIEYLMPSRRGEEIFVDGRPSWPWLVAEVCIHAVIAAGWLAYAAFGWFQREWAAVGSMAGMFAALAVLHITAGAGACQASDWRSAAGWWMEAVPEVLLAACIVLSQWRVIKALILSGALKIVAMVNPLSGSVLLVAEI
jgi:hypothetical protein